MPLESNSFIAKYGVRSISYAIGTGLAILLILIAIGSSADTVDNTDVGIVVNNITGTQTEIINGGMVFHLPFGLSSVYRISKKPRHMRLAKDAVSKDRPDSEQVRIKTSDGSNVEADIDVVYKVDVTNAYIAYRELEESEATNTEAGSSLGALGHDSTNNMESILRAVTRSGNPQPARPARYAEHVRSRQAQQHDRCRLEGSAELLQTHGPRHPVGQRPEFSLSRGI